MKFPITHRRRTLCAAGLPAIAILLVGCSSSPSLPDPLQAGWQGESVCTALIDDDRRRVLRCEFKPTGGHERHYHAAHFGYVVSGGTMRITDATGTRTASFDAGATWDSPGVDWHEVQNVGDTTSVYLIFEVKQAP